MSLLGFKETFTLFWIESWRWQILPFFKKITSVLVQCPLKLCTEVKTCLTCSCLGCLCHIDHFLDKRTLLLPRFDREEENHLKCLITEWFTNMVVRIQSQHSVIIVALFVIERVIGKTVFSLSLPCIQGKKLMIINLIKIFQKAWANRHLHWIKSFFS